MVFTLLVRLEEEHLRHAFVGVDLRRKVGGVGEFQGHLSFPLRLQRGDVDDDTAAGIGAFAQTDGQHVTRDAEILDGARQREAVRRDDAGVAGIIDEAVFVKVLGIDGGAVDIGENREFVTAADVIAVA